MLNKFKQGRMEVGQLEGIEGVFKKYGKKIKVKSQSFDEVCEREIEVVKEVHQEVEV